MMAIGKIIANSDIEMIKFIIDHKVYKFHYNEVIQATKYNNLELIKLFHQIGIKPLPENIDALSYAGKNGYLDIFKFIYENNFYSKTSSMNYVYMFGDITRNGHLNIIQYCVENDLMYHRECFNFALEGATIGNKFNILKYLLLKLSDKSYWNKISYYDDHYHAICLNNAFWYAIRDADFDIIEYLLPYVDGSNLREKLDLSDQFSPAKERITSLLYRRIEKNQLEYVKFICQNMTMTSYAIINGISLAKREEFHDIREYLETLIVK